jgi:hypothetical protein
LAEDEEPQRVKREHPPSPSLTRTSVPASNAETVNPLETHGRIDQYQHQHHDANQASTAQDANVSDSTAAIAVAQPDQNTSHEALTRREHQPPRNKSNKRSRNNANDGAVANVTEVSSKKRKKKLKSTGDSLVPSHIAESHACIIFNPYGSGGIELRCDLCGGNTGVTARDGKHDFIRGVLGMLKHFGHAHSHVLAEGEYNDSWNIINRCTYRYLSQELVQAIVNGNHDAYTIKHLANTEKGIGFWLGEHPIAGRPKLKLQPFLRPHPFHAEPLGTAGEGWEDHVSPEPLYSVQAETAAGEMGRRRSNTLQGSRHSRVQRSTLATPSEEKDGNASGGRSAVIQAESDAGKGGANKRPFFRRFIVVGNAGNDSGQDTDDCGAKDDSANDPDYDDTNYMLSRRACIPCRRRRTRCSRHTPTCQRCEEHGIACKYPSILGSPDPLSGLSGLSAVVTPRKEFSESKIHQSEKAAASSEAASIASSRPDRHANPTSMMNLLADTAAPSTPAGMLPTPSTTSAPMYSTYNGSQTPSASQQIQPQVKQEPTAASQDKLAYTPV